MTYTVADPWLHDFSSAADAGEAQVRHRVHPPTADAGPHQAVSVHPDRGEPVAG